jgi:hypothetical protein
LFDFCLFTGAILKVIKHEDRSVSRRSLLKSLSVLTGSALAWSMLPTSSRLMAAPLASPTAMPEEFIALSRSLTLNKPLDPSLAPRAWQALVQRSPNFLQHYPALAARFAPADSALRKSDLAELEQDANAKSAAVAIVSAWYLGVVGEVKARSEDGPAFITYNQAMMWNSTQNITVIPTYAHGAPGNWAEKPALI